MSSEKLFNEKKIEKIHKTEFNPELAERDIEFAKKGFEVKNYTRIMTTAYEAVLRISLKLMGFLGYRAVGVEHHKHVFEFLKEIKFDDGLTVYFDNVRKKRNDFIYRDIETITEKEAKEIIEKAEEFVHKIRTFVHKIRTEEAKK